MVQWLRGYGGQLCLGHLVMVHRYPAFISGSDHSSIYTMGSIRGFMELRKENKWITWSGWQEWYDLWSCPESNVDLLNFFDRYLKGIENNFEKPPSRLDFVAI